MIDLAAVALAGAKDAQRAVIRAGHELAAGGRVVHVQPARYAHSAWPRTQRQQQEHEQQEG